MKIITEEVKTPLICTIFGDPGLGKTSLAATFPNPIFILAEDGLKSVKPRPHSFPLLKEADEIFENLKYLRKEKHDYKTLVIDSISQLDQLFINYILDLDSNAKSFASSHGGYGAPFQMLSGLHGRVRKYASALANELGMNTVFISHVEIENISPPDGDPYSKYDLKLSKKSHCHYVDNVDLVGMIKLDYFTTGGDKKEKSKKAIDSGERVLICHAMAANVSKNRLGITQQLEVKKGENPLGDYI